MLNSNRADLTAFAQNGGKLIMHTGTADPLVPFQDAINYYERVVARESSLVRTQGFFRLFVVPGLGHGRSPGLGEFGSGQNVNTPQDSERDVLSALMRWAEQGVPPARVIATASEEVNHVRTIRLERPVFPYLRRLVASSKCGKSPADFTSRRLSTATNIKPSSKLPNVCRQG